MSFEHELSKAKTNLVMNRAAVFFSSIIIGLEHIKDESNLENTTACTDGLKVWYNPDFFLKLTKEEREFLIGHESMHVVLEHCDSRRDGKDHELWNKAGDYVINLMLVDNGFKMPANGLFDRRFANMSTAEVYRILEKEESQKPGTHKQPGFQGDLQPGKDSSTPGQQPSKAQRAEMKEKVERLIMQARQQATMQGGFEPGKLSQDLQALIERLTTPRIPWQKIMDRFCQASVKEDQSYSKPHRKYLPHGFHMPTLDSPGVGRLMWANDISGSVSQREWNQSISEMAYILKRYNPEEISVLQFNTRIVEETVVRSVKEFMDIPFRKGGGTDVGEVMEKFNKDRAEALFVFTDGYLHQDHLVRPRKPVLWLIYDNPSFEPLFGKAIHFSARDLNLN